MQLNPYLIFNGQCDAAFKFYEQCLGGKIVARFTYGEMPGAAEHVSQAMYPRIMHTCLHVGDAVLMGSDSQSDNSEESKGVYVSLHVDSPAEAERIFHALAEGGEVRMPIGETFWAARFGMLVDRYGTPWMINCEKAA
jgi:PhnB protein